MVAFAEGALPAVAMPEGLLRPGEVPGFLNVSRATFYRLKRRVPKVRIPVEHPGGRTTYLTRYDPCSRRTR